MELIEIMAIGFALSMDTFSVGLSVSMQRHIKHRQVLYMAASFAIFQAIMPIIGWLLGVQVKDFIEAYDHWVAFILLAYIGWKMLMEARAGQESSANDPTSVYTLLILSIATSIDALAVGISFAALSVDIYYPALIIGIICFMVTIVGMYLGSMLAKSKLNLASYANILGGLLLIGIGIKILIEHGVFKNL